MNAITLIWRQVLKELKLFQMKNNNWDCIILTHDQFAKIPQSEETMIDNVVIRQINCIQCDNHNVNI